MAKQNRNQTHVPGKERRHYPRYALGCPAELFPPAAGHWRNQIVHSRTDNISNGGCYITLEKYPELQTDQSLQLELNVPRHTPNTYMLEPVRTAVRIVRIETARPSDTGLALEFEKPVELQLEE
jgi:PilZ domain